MKKFIYSIAAITLFAGTGHAQSAPEASGAPSAAQTPPEAAAEPATSADPADPADHSADAAPPADAAAPIQGTPSDASAYSDAEVDSFAKAAVKVQEINEATASPEEKQTQMAAAVTESGLEPAKYNEIMQALSTDAELRSRVQLAMSRHANPSDG